MKIPGTPVEALDYARLVYERSRIAGRWDRDAPLVESLVTVIQELASASHEYAEDRILPVSFYRPTGIQTAEGGAVVFLARAVIRLLDLAGRQGVTPVLWGGMERAHGDFYPNLFAIMARVTRLPNNYPTDAIAMIEKLAVTWMSRADFWGVVIEMEKRR